MAITRLNYGSSFTNLVKSDSFLDGNSAYIPSSFESIATVTLGSSSSTISFSSIPSTYKSLQIRGISRDTYTGAGVDVEYYIRPNGDATNAYAIHYLYGNGSTAAAAGAANSTGGGIVWGSAGGVNAANIFGASIVDIVDYASTSKNKTIRALGGTDANGSGQIALSSALWINTSAISSITLAAGTTAFAAGSTFALYGIKG